MGLTGGKNRQLLANKNPGHNQLTVTKKNTTECSQLFYEAKSIIIVIVIAINFQLQLSYISLIFYTENGCVPVVVCTNDISF